MINIIKFLEGKKTYILSVFTASYTLLQVFNVINTTPDQDKAVYGFLIALLGMSIRAAITKK